MKVEAVFNSTVSAFDAANLGGTLSVSGTQMANGVGKVWTLVNI